MAALTEQIMDECKTRLTGLSLTGSNILRSNVWDVSSLPALRLQQGAESYDVQDGNDSYVMSDFDIHITAIAKDSSTIETTLNSIRAQVYSALMRDNTLGLDFVHEVLPVSVSQPTIQKDETTSGFIEMVFNVKYEHAFTDTEVQFI